MLWIKIKHIFYFMFEKKPVKKGSQIEKTSIIMLTFWSVVNFFRSFLKLKSNKMLLKKLIKLEKMYMKSDIYYLQNSVKSYFEWKKQKSELALEWLIHYERNDYSQNGQCVQPKKIIKGFSTKINSFLL